MILEFLMTFAPSPLMGEGEDEGENQDFDSRLGVLNYPGCNFKQPPHLNPLPLGERRKRKRSLPPGERRKKKPPTEGAREKRIKEFRVPSPLMGEGQDEGENQDFDSG